MKLSTIAKTISVLSYCFIMLRGDMIALPFGIWLFMSLFDFSSIGPLFALIAFSGGFVACGTKKSDKFYVLKLIASFLFLLSPLLWRLSVVPLYIFNYTSFIIPMIAFIIFFLLAFVLDLKDFLNKAEPNKKQLT